MKRTLVGLTALALTLAACSGDASVSETFSEIGSGLNAGGDVYYGEEPAAPVEDSGGEGSKSASNRLNLDVALSSDRKVIRNASLQLEADDTRATFDEIVRIAEDAGGFVSSAEVSPTNDDEQPVIRITVRVPSAEMTNALAAFKDAAVSVVSESQGAEDVTETYIDLEAQLTNLRALEVELRALLAEVSKQPDADPDKLLRVFTEISNTRGQIEQIQGQLDYLSEAVDLATVQMSIEPTAQAVPIVEEGWAPTETARSATRSLVAALQNIGDAAITFAIAVLPMLLLVVGIPALVFFLGYRWWSSRRKETPPPASTGSPLPAE